MIEGMGSLKAAANTSVQEGAKSSPRPRQGAGQPEAEARVAEASRKAVTEPAQLEVEQVAELAEELHKALEPVNGDFSVSVDGDTGMVVVRIKDADTGDVMKQIPPQQLLDANANMDKIIGLLVDDLA